MNDTDTATRDAQAQHIRDLITKLNERELLQLSGEISVASQAQHSAGLRYGEAALLHAIGGLTDQELAEIRGEFERARDRLVCLQLQASAVPRLREKLTTELEPLVSDHKAALREMHATQYAAAREDFVTNYEQHASDENLARNARALFELAARVGKARDCKDMFHSLRHRRNGATLQQYV